MSFRAFARRTAQSLGLRGWVRNLPDGTVEIEVTGPEEALGTFRRRLADGPAFARVEGLDVQPLRNWTQTPSEDGFTIIF